MANIVPYINFIDKSDEAVTFYKGVFGGEAEVQREGERVIHFDLQAGDIHFMGSDNQGDEAGSESTSGCSLVLNCDSEDQLGEFYTKLVKSGKAVFEPTDSGWGAIIAHCTDQFGVTWLLNFDKPQNG